MALQIYNHEDDNQANHQLHPTTMTKDGLCIGDRSVEDLLRLDQYSSWGMLEDTDTQEAEMK